MDNSTAILVLGMPRSGTSAITRVLNLHGAALSEKLLPAAKPNPKGFFESADALAIHERLLTAMGRTWYDIAEMPDGWLDFPETRAAQDELEVLVRRDYIDKTLWVIKEPRMCRLVPLWLRVLEALNISPRVLLVARHPEEVVRSVARMVGEDQWSPEHTKILWLEYFFEAEKSTRGLPRALITYDQLLKDWEFHVGRIAGELGVEWPKSSAAAKLEVDAYLGSENRHHSYMPAENADEVDKLTLAEKVYATCNEMNGDYWVALTALNSEFSAAFAFFQRPMQDLIHKVDSRHVNIASTQQIEMDELRLHHNTVFFSQQAELEELRRYHNSVFLSQQTELDELRRYHNSVFLSQKSELDELRAHNDNLFLSQQAELDKLVLALEHAKDEAAATRREMAELTIVVDGLSAALSSAKAREEKVSSALIEAQSSYSALLALTGSRKWLIRKLFTASKKN